MTSRYVYCPMAGKIRKDLPNPLRWLRRRLARNAPDVWTVANCYPAYYPAGYKK